MKILFFKTVLKCRFHKHVFELQLLLCHIKTQKHWKEVSVEAAGFINLLFY